MAFKIYTYADPYKICQTDFWEEIKYYPHLCASRTLVRGLMSVLDSKEIQALICPLDAIVKDRVFVNWTKDISRRIQQYSKLGQVYKDLYNNEDASLRLDECQLKAFSHNKNSMLDALRLFIELGIRSDSLDTSRLNLEHKVFVYLLRFFEKRDLFRLPSMPTIKQFKTHLEDQSQKELSDKVEMYERGDRTDSDAYKRDIEVINRMISNTAKWDCKHLVVHGIHQFTPLQLRLLTYLDKLGVEIIFLYNYLPEFKEIYSSWSYIYQQFDAPIHHDERIKKYEPRFQLPRTGQAIATNLALLCEENTQLGDNRIRENYKHYESVKVQEFDNISEYAGYVSDLFAAAEKRLIENQPAREQVLGKRPSTSRVLARMDDVIYTANKDVDELLQVYHPEYARNRHFLSYPIGQFFVALYELWNTETKEINIDFNLLRQCVNSGVLSGYHTEQLLKTLMNVEPLFEHVSTFSEFKKVFEDYKTSYGKVVNSHSGTAAFPIKMINLYNSYKVPVKENDDLFKAICDLNTSAKKLFSDADKDEQFQFGNHFSRLKEFVDERQTALADEEERDLIEKLLNRLETVQKQIELDRKKGIEHKGTLDDLRSGLYFFLKQKEEPVPDWFVRNFEQIDGDVLLSKKQNTPGREKTYHFACVSDKDMNKKVDELLPWPLSDLFIERAYNPKELPFQVYYAALSERSNFLRYALFYGLYFSQCETKISFVKRYGDDTTDYYEMLRLIGLKKDDNPDRNVPEDYPTLTYTGARKVNSIKYDRVQMADMFLCPYRYMMDYVLNPQPVLSGDFLIKKYFVNLVVENTWIATDGMVQKTVMDKLSMFIDQETSKLIRFFPFFRESEVIDLKKQAENYYSSQVIREELSHVRKHEPTHMEFRRIFGNAEFFEDLQKLPRNHTYEAFENLAKVKDGKKSYSVHSVPKTENKQLTDCVLKYINESAENAYHAGSWCMYCPDRNICLASYKEAQE